MNESELGRWKLGMISAVSFNLIKPHECHLPSSTGLIKILVNIWLVQGTYV
jgi:hypothetical protein